MKILFWIIFIFILLGYAFRFFLKYGLPWLLGKMIRNQQNKYTDFQGGGTNNQNPKQEGEVKIKTNKQNKHQHNSNDDEFGEYVDFEDVD